MKKIFLTSGIIACMACPAFATGFDATNGAVPANAGNGACVEDVIGTTSGTSNLTAQWRKHEGTFSFDNGISWTNTCASDSSVSHSDATAPQANLYSRYDTGVWLSSSDRTSDTNGTNTASTMTAPSRAGYEFNGYYDNSGLTGSPVITSGGAISNGISLANLITADGGSATLYAKWTPETYTGAITYACGSYTDNRNVSQTVSAASGADSTQDVRYDDCYSLDSIANQCEAPDGYTFGGWDCKQGNVAYNLPGATKTLPVGASTPTYYAAGAGGVWNVDFSNETTVTCTAIWNANGITLNWTATGAEGWTAPAAGDPESSCTYNGNVTLPTDPSKTGYTFTGWAVTSTNP